MASEHDKKILNAIFNPLLPIGEDISGGTINKIELPITDEEKEAAAIEVEGVNSAEVGNLEEALNLFDRAAKVSPNRASIYNNRAQVKRLLNDTKGALEDLNIAIELSGKHGNVYERALCQRGMIYRFEGKKDDALEDFKEAAQLGNSFAKTMVAQMNPYAAMCNKMLHDMFTKLKNGETDDAVNQ
ncbi:tetratricopeptide repeat protein 36 homolog [Artemia franciscana]|uniref:Tetratricopeptide repeat protein 36 n=1 Tax=Artemia franciscana TaxID=6661 RepID=A0AA88HIU4_ARTSF|nr:hypothetical protein QYM36_013637 [Artemia franciscana]